MRSFPPDVVVLDMESLTHARLGRGKANPRIVNAKTYRIAPETFTTAPVTPLVANEAALAETLRRLRMETGKWDKVSILLPDSWFRINIVDLPSLPDRDSDATDVVRWSLKKTLPIPPEQLPIAKLAPGDYVVRAIVNAADQPPAKVYRTLRKVAK